ncbi:MAG TPA: hypothetical protein VHZ55_18685 [Bryobacteraceae bacterium]|jgi:hypothetical protein|nr:hypothetical protein [Bryobacteraceae bacterium]
MDSTELRRLAAEASLQHGIRIDPDDPIMAVVTLNRLVLENVLSEGLRSIRTAAEEFTQAAERVQIRAGAAVGYDVRECVAAIRGELQKDIDEARLHACELVEELHRAQSRWSIVRWIAVGILSGAVLFASGFYSGVFLR